MRESTFEIKAPTFIRRSAAIIVVVIVLAILLLNSVTSIKTGHVGIVTMFGRVTGRTMGEGIHLVNPLARVTELNIKTQEVKEHASVPSKEGLVMGLETSVPITSTRRRPRSTRRSASTTRRCCSSPTSARRSAA